MFLCVRGSNVVFKQGKKTDGAVNAHAVNVTMKRKYRYVNYKEDKGFYLHGAVCWSCCTQPHAADQLLFYYMVFLVIVWTPVVQVTELIRQTSSVPSQWALSASTTVIIANHLCRCFYAEIPALPLVLDDVICKCCEGNSDVMCFYIYFFCRQYMNRKGGFNRPLDFIAWKYEQVIVIPDELTLVLPLQ